MLNELILSKQEETLPSTKIKKSGTWNLGHHGRETVLENKRRRIKRLAAHQRGVAVTGQPRCLLEPF